MADDKVRENRLRRAAERRGLLLVKRRRMDPKAFDYGLYVLVEDVPANRSPRYGGQAAIDAFERREGMTIDEVEEKINNL